MDYVNWQKWNAILNAAKTLRPDLDDALPMYEHFRDGSGTPMTFDFEEGFQEDPAIRRQVNGEMQESINAANELVNTGYTSTEFYSTVKDSVNAETYNWQKLLVSTNTIATRLLRLRVMWLLPQQL